MYCRLIGREGAIDLHLIRLQQWPLLHWVPWFWYFYSFLSLGVVLLSLAGVGILSLLGVRLFLWVVLHEGLATRKG